MIPYKDDNPQILTPFGTYFLLGLNVLTWAFYQGFGETGALTQSICSSGTIPAMVNGQEINFNECMSGNSGNSTILSSMFLHGSWMHLLGNMLFLWVFGGNVEDAMGTLRFLVFYLVSGMIATSLQVMSEPSSEIPIVGASGAIGGVMGGYLLLYPKVRVHLFVFFVLAFPVTLPAYMMLGYWFVIQLFSGISSEAGVAGIAFWAHAGGFMAGVILALVLKDRELLEGHEYYGWTQQPNPKTLWELDENKFHE